MNKNQALVWITIIVVFFAYSLTSVVHSKKNYIAKIETLKQTIVNKNLEIKELKKKGELLDFERAELINEAKYKKDGKLSQKVIALQKDNISITKIIDRYSNLKIRNTRKIEEYNKLLLKMTAKEETKLFKIEQAKREKAKKEAKKTLDKSILDSSEK